MGAQPVVPSGFSIQGVVLDPFVSPPSAFAFLPDGRVLITEKDTGHVRLSKVGDTASSIILTVPNVTFEEERGLLGVAVDPQWPQRPYVYFYSTCVGEVIQITLYTAIGALSDPSSSVLALVDPYTVVDRIPDETSIHNGGTLRFGPDGYLYASVGEDSDPCEAQFPNVLLGKILRIDVSGVPRAPSGPPPRDQITPIQNPYVGGALGEWDPLIYAHGLRNPFRFTIDPQTGNLYVGDVGHATWEEVNELVRFGPLGSNFGWPEWEGPLLHPIPGADMCSLPPFVPPIYVYPNPAGASNPAAVVCGPRYRTDPHAPYSFSRAYEGDVFVADFYGGWIQRLASDDAGVWSRADSVAGQPSAQSWASNLGLIVDLQQGPDGGLYFLNYGFSALARGLYRIVNTRPSETSGWTSDALRVRSVPNPAVRGAGVQLEFRLARADRSTLRIYDPAGRLVQTLVQPVGVGGSVHWDGRASDGRRLAAGIYLLELRTASGEHTHGRIVLAR